MASSPVRKSTAQSNTSNRSSAVSSPAKNPNPTATSTTTAAKRLSNMNPTRSNSVNTHGSADELERERAKVSSLKALITAAEEKEADATAQAANWRSKADQLSNTIDRMEAELAEAQELKTNYERLTKELEKLKAAHKELERTQFRQADEHEASKAAWAEEESNLRAQLSTSNSQLLTLQKQYDESNKADSVPSQPGSPIKPAPSEVPDRLEAEHTTAALKAEVEALKAQQAANQATLEQAIASSETLKTQLADLERVNEQLMDDNESYQFLVGERTLMGGFDIKQLLRVDEGESAPGPSPVARRNSPSSSSTPSLEGVEEEDEEEEEDDDEDADAAIERAVLESHGDGSRTTGAVEAGISKNSKPKRIPHRRNEPTGLGLDLAAELAQAEETEVHHGRKVELEERKKTKKINKDKDTEIKALQDTNKALVLYISKILDRISAHDGFEKVLSSDYTKDGPNSPARQRTRSATTAHTAASGPQTAKGGPANIASTAANPAAKRSSWLQYFMRSPPAASNNIKPLRLGTGSSVTPGASAPSAGLSGGWAGVKEQPELEEDDEEACARERRIAEMKLHGTYQVDFSSSGESGKPQDATIRANRRSSSMYGPSQAAMTVVEEKRRNSGEIGGVSKLSLLPSIDSSLVPLSQAGLMKRTEEREKESKINLEKGQASGFTEIEIRGHRMRPSVARQSTTPNHPLSPAQSNFSLSPSKSASSSTATAPTPAPGGIKGLKMTADLNNTTNEPANEGLLARTARRISMMSGTK
ncbi:hypothetical protein PGT21_034949 [Puccinia graminis f. sp. tritici]|uniref:Uncharacterized protein n=1 Tax=Puccinia graminis f. sp. tritici TaxID=56615 RepID=A0A5B0NQN1_PUCGR|nr:hypothetical protein PGTUg99_036251 [Puccinia graminis f. sp. tritici]KAA1091505.1 hypothetical protein PGT21_034949 [Puccinia graminis f. sp. tritici]